jgi:hypothetical protein
VTAIGAASIAAALALGIAGAAAASPPPVAVLARAPARDIAAELSRLAGQRVLIAPGRDGYRILDVAGEGEPLVGVVERRGNALWLRPERGPAHRLAGPLAIPRIAGPGYTIWVLGRAAPDGSLVARRIGVLAPPRWPPRRPGGPSGPGV